MALHWAIKPERQAVQWGGFRRLRFCGVAASNCITACLPIRLICLNCL